MQTIRNARLWQEALKAPQMRQAQKWHCRNFVKKINGDYDILCLLQATSPLTTSSDIHNVLCMITEEKFDSALTVVQDKRFIWDKSGKPLNYDYTKRPRRQEFDGLLIENGAVYATTKEQFDRSKIRIGGKIGIVTMPDDTLVEIDEPRDWVIMEKLMENRLRQNKKLASKIKTLFLDVDGVLHQAVSLMVKVVNWPKNLV